MNRKVIGETVKSVIIEVAKNKGEDMVIESGDQAIVEDLGFASLDVAVLVATLETKLGVDPFLENKAVITEIRTVDDLCKVYARCLLDDDTENENDELPATGGRRKQAMNRRDGRPQRTRHE